MGEAQAAVYWDQLQDADDEKMRKAVRQAVAHCDRLPTVAVLRRHYQDVCYRARLERGPPQLTERSDPEVARYYIDLMRRKVGS